MQIHALPRIGSSSGDLVSCLTLLATMQDGASMSILPKLQDTDARSDCHALQYMHCNEQAGYEIRSPDLASKR
jgi:glycosyltransferase A (GT-A) superfamily protein (DUF2064 family)